MTFQFAQHDTAVDLVERGDRRPRWRVMIHSYCGLLLLVVAACRAAPTPTERAVREVALVDVAPYPVEPLAPADCLVVGVNGMRLERGKESLAVPTPSFITDPVLAHFLAAKRRPEERTLLIAVDHGARYGALINAAGSVSLAGYSSIRFLLRSGPTLGARAIDLTDWKTPKPGENLYHDMAAIHLQSGENVLLGPFPTELGWQQALSKGDAALPRLPVEPGRLGRAVEGWKAAGCNGSGCDIAVVVFASNGVPVERVLRSFVAVQITPAGQPVFPHVRIGFENDDDLVLPATEY